MSGFGFTSAGTSYDDEDRLTGFARASGTFTQSWILTSVGDWNSVTTNGTAQNRTHGPTHELLTAGGQNVTTDVKGNITLLPTTLTTSGVAMSVGYDFDNKLKSADVDNNGSSEVTFQYDALGRRVARLGTGGSLVFVQHDQQTIADYGYTDAPSSPLYRYVYASYIDEPVVRKGAGTGGTIHYFHRNQQYSVTAVTTSTGSVAERYAYTAYGQPTFLDASGTPLTTQTSTLNARYLYTGREWDATLGLYHFRARWMSGVAGRFLGRDPIGFNGGSISLVEYCHGKSFVFVDPSGLQIRPLPSVPWSPYPYPTSPLPPPSNQPSGTKITWSPGKSIDKCNEWKPFFEDYVNKGPCAKKYNVKLSCTNCFGKRQGDYTEPKKHKATTTCKTKTTGNEILVEACGDQTDPDIMFSVLKHEFQHVIDICKTCSECELVDKQDGETDKHHCFDRLCMELRSFITQGVCDDSEFDENKRKECLRRYLTEYLDIPFHKVICTKEVLDVVMTKCYTEYRVKAPDFPAVPDVFPKNPWSR